MAIVSSSHTPDTPSLHITHEQGASHVVEISNNGTDYILELNQNVAANNIVVNGDGEGDYQLVVTQSTDDFNVVIGVGGVSGEDNVQSDWQETNSAADSFILNKPVLFDGQYGNLTGLPTLFDGDYNSLSNLPTLFDGAYTSLTGLPTLFDGDYNSLTNLPTLFDGAYASLSGLPTLFSESYNDLTDLPTLFDGAYSSLSGLPTLFSEDYNDLTNLPTLGTAAATASTDYATAAQGLLADSAVQPADIADFATETYVDTAVSNLVDAAPGTLDTLNELADALGDDPNFATTVATSIATKAPLVHTHVAADVTDFDAEVSNNTSVAANTLKVTFPGFGTTAGTALEGDTALFDGAYGSLTGTPSTFTPSAHTHTASEITDFDTEVSNNSSVAANTSKVTFPGFGTTAGTALEGDTALFSGVYNDLTSKPTLFDGDYNSLTNLPTLFDGAYGSLSGLPTLGTAAAAATTDFAAASHTHVIADVTGLQTALDNAGEDNVQADWDETDTGADAFILNKPTVPSGIDDLSDVDTTTLAASTGDVLRWSGTVWAPDAPASGGTQSDWDETNAADPAFILNKPTAVADLEHNYVRVLLPSSHLTGGGSQIDFDLNSKTQVTGFTSDETVGSGLTFASDQFTAGNDGLYTFNAAAEFKSTVTQRPAPTLHFRVNGTEVEGKSLAYVRQNNIVDEGTANLTRTFNLTAGDTVQVWFQNQGVVGSSVVTSEQFLFEGHSLDVTVIGVDGVIGDDNVQSDWNQTNAAADDFILNKPTIPTAFSGVYNDLTGKPTLVTSIDGLSDVDTATSAPTVGDVLEWDGSNWVPATPSGGGATTRQFSNDAKSSMSSGEANTNYLWPGQLQAGKGDADSDVSTNPRTNSSATYAYCKNLGHRPGAGTWSIELYVNLSVGANNSGTTSRSEWNAEDVDIIITKHSSSASASTLSDSEVITIGSSTHFANEGTVSLTGIVLTSSDYIVVTLKPNFSNTSTAYCFWSYDIDCTKTA